MINSINLYNINNAYDIYSDEKCLVVSKIVKHVCNGNGRASARIGKIEEKVLSGY